MRTYTATITITDEEAKVVEQAAAWFGMDVQAFLDDALTSGIAHAEDIMASAEPCGCGACSRDRPRHAAGDLDDDIPF